MADSIDKLSYSSIRHYLHGIATTQQELGYPNPLTRSPLLWRMFKAIKRIQGKQVVRQRLPITVKILAQIDPLFDTIKRIRSVHASRDVARYMRFTPLWRVHPKVHHSHHAQAPTLDFPSRKTTQRWTRSTQEASSLNT